MKRNDRPVQENEHLTSLGLEISQNTGVCDPMMNSFSTPVPPAVTELTESREPSSHEGAKLTFYGFVLFI